MNPIENPFNPGAGIPPPELEGREALLEQAGIILARVLLGRGEKNMILTGLRGVGKTVLLNKIRVMAEGEGYKTIFIEASEEKPLAPQLATGLSSLVYELSYMAAAGKAAKRAMRLLSGFIKSLKVAYQDFSISLDMGPDAGTAGTGDIEIDLPDLFQAVGNAAREQNTGVALFIDEIQYLESNELGALIMAIHRIQQHQLPVVLFAAGLPTLPGLAGDAKSYAERLFDFPIIGPLTEEESAKALNQPARAANAHFEDDAIEEIFHKTKGYPYFLQEWGYQSWNESPTPTITLKVVKTATEKVVKRLDNNFFRVRFDRLTPMEKRFLRAMAELGAGSHKTGDIAKVLNVKVNSLSPARKKLIEKGMIYSPTHGELTFSVPLFDEFMVRVIPDLE